MHVNFNELKQIMDVGERGDRIAEIIRDCAPNDPVFLSDCMLHATGPGHDVLIALDASEAEALRDRMIPMQWRIKVIRDCWGNPPEPGDRVARKRKKSTRKRNGKFYTAQEMSIFKINGTYEQMFEPVTYFDLDEKGCMTCGFQDAAHFLNLWGIHPVTKSPITNHIQREHSSEPLMSPDGNMYHKWNHLYMEITSEHWERLPNIEKSDKPKRGIKKEY